MPVSIDDIASYTAGFFNVSLDDLRGRARTLDISRPRQCAFVLCRELVFHASFNRIGRYFGGRDHTTIKFGIDSVKRREDPVETQFLEAARQHFATTDSTKPHNVTLRRFPWQDQ